MYNIALKFHWSKGGNASSYQSLQNQQALFLKTSEIYNVENVINYQFNCLQAGMECQDQILLM